MLSSQTRNRNDNIQNSEELKIRKTYYQRLWRKVIIQVISAGFNFIEIKI